MKKNEGTTDRIIRGILALVSIYFALTYSYWIFILTVMLIVTALKGYCGLYALLGVRTCPMKKTKKAKKAKK